MKKRTGSVFSQEYEDSFMTDLASAADNSRIRLAYERAEQIRQFEIGLYWTRSTYFWAFIGATMAGYGAVKALPESEKSHQMCLIAAAMGFVFSVAWYFANRGSKQWHENWENHVDLLEDQVTGPLHKTILRRAKPIGITAIFLRSITGSGLYSVSKINQIVSCFVIGLWGLILWEELQIDVNAQLDVFAVKVMSLTVIACLTMKFMGKTDGVNTQFSATRRLSQIEGPRQTD